jgi:mRNA interferase MazF
LPIADGVVILQRNCVVSFDNLHTLPRSAFRRRATILSPARMRDACTALADALGCGG